MSSARGNSWEEKIGIECPAMNGDSGLLHANAGDHFPANISKLDRVLRVKPILNGISPYEQWKGGHLPRRPNDRRSQE